MTTEHQSPVEGVTHGVQQLVTDVQTQTKEVAWSMSAMVRRVLLAGVGAMVLTREEIEEFVAKLVERGEIAEQDGRRLVKEVLSRRHAEAEEAVEKAEEESQTQVARLEAMLDQRIEGILVRLHVPTKHDIDALSQRIARLEEKVDGSKTS